MYPCLLTDDLKLASSSPIDLQNDLLSLLMWSIEHKLSFNFEKTKLLHVSKISVICDHPVLFMGSDISLIYGSIRDLRVMVSPNLIWTSHVNF